MVCSVHLLYLFMIILCWWVCPQTFLFHLIIFETSLGCCEFVCFCFLLLLSLLFVFLVLLFFHVLWVWTCIDSVLGVCICSRRHTNNWVRWSFRRIKCDVECVFACAYIHVLVYMYLFVQNVCVWEWKRVFFFLCKQLTFLPQNMTIIWSEMGSFSCTSL